MSPSRRTLLATLPALVSGCSALSAQSTPTSRPDRDGDGIPDGGDDYPDDAALGTRKSRVAGTPTLPPGEYSGVALPNNVDPQEYVLHYEVAVVGAGSVDCVALSLEDWDAFVDGARDVPVIERYTRRDVTDVEVTEPLAHSGVFAVDHTGLLTEPAQDAVRVDMTVDVAWAP